MPATVSKRFSNSRRSASSAPVLLTMLSTRFSKSRRSVSSASAEPLPAAMRFSKLAPQFLENAIAAGNGIEAAFEFLSQPVN